MTGRVVLGEEITAEVTGRVAPNRVDMVAAADIAQRLFISRHTLSDHMKAMFAKLGVTSRSELTALLLDQVLATS